MEKHIFFNNLKFTRDEKTGYYLNSTHRKRLHRYVWEYNFGPIPEGLHVHHIDGDKNNNDISNLKLMSAIEHGVYHGGVLLESERDLKRKHISENVLPKAIEWHGSEDGKEWHKEQYAKYLGEWANNKITKECEQCKEEYNTQDREGTRFCSNKCKAKWRRESGLDDEVRACEYCGKEFTVNKYSAKKFCSRSCSKKNYWEERTE